MNTRWLILGGSSGIAKPLARELARRGNDLVLAVRDSESEQIQILRNDIIQRSKVQVDIIEFDAENLDENSYFFSRVEQKFGHIHGLVWAIGLMNKLEEGIPNIPEINYQHKINYTAAVSTISPAAEIMEKRRRGHIVIFGSPAGDRGRRKNFYYGADKAALHAYAQGLRHKLAFKGVKVLTVKPGPTDTNMTADFSDKQKLASPYLVAKDIAKAVDTGTEILYTPFKWRIIMHIVKHIPNSIFKFLNI